MNYCSTLHNAQLCKETLTTIGPSSEIETSEEKKKQKSLKSMSGWIRNSCTVFFFFWSFSFSRVCEGIRNKTEITLSAIKFQTFLSAPSEAPVTESSGSASRKVFFEVQMRGDTGYKHRLTVWQGRVRIHLCQGERKGERRCVSNTFSTLGITLLNRRKLSNSTAYKTALLFKTMESSSFSLMNHVSDFLKSNKN